MGTSMTKQNNPLWQYSLMVYPKPGVESLLLRLQDDFGVDINILLACCWQGAHGLLLSPDQWASVIQFSAGISEGCVIPLRGVRRFVREQPQLAGFYQQVKILELEAEWQQQQIIYQQINHCDVQKNTHNDFSACAEQNINNYCQSQGGVEWQEIRPLITVVLTAVDRDSW